MPKNCSIGMKEFCIGFDSHVKCDKLPLNITLIMPETIRSFILDEISPIDDVISNLTPAALQFPFIFGLATLSIIMVIILVYFCLKRELIKFKIMIGVP